MLYLSLGLVIHEERQREIERTLRNRRLLETVREASTAAAASRVTTRAAGGRQERAGAAS